MLELSRSNKFNNKVMNSLFTKISEGVEEIYKSDRWAEHLRTVSKFYKYSSRNIILIKKQKPNATFVAGYKKWQTEFNRFVKKGEKGIKILVPIKVKDKNNSDSDIVDKAKYKIIYKYANVFDISQTEGENLKVFETRELEGKVKNIDKLIYILNVIAYKNNCKIKFSKNLNRCKGYYSLKTNTIVIKDNMSQIQTIKTIIHELAHSFLHNSEDTINRKSKQSIEIEAESVAYIVLNVLGVDTSDYSFDYIALWAQKFNNIELLNILENIRDLSYHLVSEIQDKLDNPYLY